MGMQNSLASATHHIFPILIVIVLIFHAYKFGWHRLQVLLRWFVLEEGVWNVADLSGLFPDCEPPSVVIFTRDQQAFGFGERQLVVILTSVPLLGSVNLGEERATLAVTEQAMLCKYNCNDPSTIPDKQARLLNSMYLNQHSRPFGYRRRWLV